MGTTGGENAEEDGKRPGANSLMCPVKSFNGGGKVSKIKKDQEHEMFQNAVKTIAI